MKNALLLVAKKSDIIRLVCKARAGGGRKPNQGGGGKEANK